MIGKAKNAASRGSNRQWSSHTYAAPFVDDTVSEQGEIVNGDMASDKKGWLPPQMVTKGSNKKVWRLGKCGPEKKTMMEVIMKKIDTVASCVGTIA